MQANDAERFFQYAVEAEDRSSLQLQEALFHIIVAQKEAGTLDAFKQNLKDVMSRSFEGGNQAQRVRLIDCFKQHAKISSRDIEGLTSEKSNAKNASSQEKMNLIIDSAVDAMSGKTKNFLADVQDRNLIRSGLGPGKKKRERLQAVETYFSAIMQGRDPFDGTKSFYSISESVVRGFKNSHATKIKVFTAVANTIYKVAVSANGAQNDPEALQRNLMILSDKRFNLIDANANVGGDLPAIQKMIKSSMLWMKFEHDVLKKIQSHNVNGVIEYLSFEAEYGLPSKEYSTFGALIRAVANDPNDFQEIEGLMNVVFNYVNSADSVSTLKGRCAALDNLGFLKPELNSDYKLFLERVDQPGVSIDELKGLFSAAFDKASFGSTLGAKFRYHMDRVIDENSVLPQSDDVNQIVTLMTQLKNLPDERKAYFGLEKASTVCSAKANSPESGTEYCLAFTNIILVRIESDYKSSVRSGDPIDVKLDNIFYACQAMNLFHMPPICELLGQDPSVNIITSVVEGALKKAIEVYDVEAISHVFEVAREIGFDKTRNDFAGVNDPAYKFDHQKMMHLIDIGIAHAEQIRTPPELIQSLSQMKYELNCVSNSKQPKFFPGKPFSPIGLAAAKGDKEECSRILSRMVARDFPDSEIEATYKNMMIIAAQNGQIELIEDVLMKSDAYGSVASQDFTREVLCSALVATEVMTLRDAGNSESSCKERLLELAKSNGAQEKELGSLQRSAAQENRRSRSMSISMMPDSPQLQRSMSMTLSKRGTNDRGGDVEAQKSQRSPFLLRKRSGSTAELFSSRPRSSSVRDLAKSGFDILRRSRSNSTADTASSAESEFDSENEKSISFGKK